MRSTTMKLVVKAMLFIETLLELGRQPIEKIKENAAAKGAFEISETIPLIP
jgi:hypothetical protein